MTPEELADECVRKGFNDGIMRQRIIDAIRRAAVDDDLRRRVGIEAGVLCDRLREMSEHPPRIVSQEIDADGHLVSHTRTVETDEAYVATLERLAWLLGLTPQERVFIQATLEAPQDRDQFQVFADYLEEQSRPEHATRLRAISPRPGQVVVLTLPQGQAGGPDRTKEMQRWIQEVFPGQRAVILFGEQTLDQLDEDAMAGAGWVHPVHWTHPASFLAACGADVPNQATTQVRAHVTCPACLALMPPAHCDRCGHSREAHRELGCTSEECMCTGYIE
jgi:uncharacterized protein (TIGR02996 family)